MPHQIVFPPIRVSVGSGKWGGEGGRGGGTREEKGKEKRKRKGERKDYNFRIPLAEQ
jgi:hypothetical protein